MPRKSATPAPPAPMYTLTLTEAQARVLVAALDGWSRIHLGQIHNSVMDVWRWRSVDQGRREGAEALLVAAGNLLTGLRDHASHSIHSDKASDEARIAYDIQQVIRHRVAWDHSPPEPGEFGSVWHYEPSRTSAEQPLATIERLET